MVQPKLLFFRFCTLLFLSVAPDSIRAEWSFGVISDERSVDFASVLETSLSGIDGVILLERSQLGVIAEEWTTSKSTASVSTLATASTLIFVDSVEAGKKEALILIRAVESKTGVTVFRRAIAADESGIAGMERVGGQIFETVQSIGETQSEAPVL